MPSAPSIPDLLLRHFAWRNRIEQWRSKPAESAFTGFAFATFIGFGLWIADPRWTGLLHGDAAWAKPLPATLLAMTLVSILLVRAHRHRKQLARSERDDWLAAMPIPAAMRQQARRQQVSQSITVAALAIIGLCAWAAVRAEQPSIALLLALFGGASAGVAASRFMPEPRNPATAIARSRATAVAVPPGTSGLALLGAALEPAVARLPRGAPWVAGCFMLLPPSTPAIAIPGLILLFTATSMAFDLVAHWRTRFLADQFWLAAQPLAPARLFRAYLLPLTKRGTLLAFLVGACLHALGAPALFAWLLALALWLLLGDAVLCGFATRREPWRFPLLLALHGVILLSTTQVLPPVLPLALLACAWMAWRRGLQ